MTEAIAFLTLEQPWKRQKTKIIGVNLCSCVYHYVVINEQKSAEQKGGSK